MNITRLWIWVPPKPVNNRRHDWGSGSIFMVPSRRSVHRDAERLEPAGQSVGFRIEHERGRLSSTEAEPERVFMNRASTKLFGPLARREMVGYVPAILRTLLRETPAVPGRRPAR